MTRLNCDALLALSYAFLKSAKKDDALINVASVVGIVPIPSLGVYCATKAFVVSLTESLWFEQKQKGVYVMALCPGSTTTLFHDRSGGSKETSPPDLVTQTPGQVVSIALRALKKRSSPIVVSGVKNNLFTSMSRMVPEKLLVTLMGKMR